MPDRYQQARCRVGRTRRNGAVTRSGAELRAQDARALRREPKIPASAFGPRLMALIALVTGVYHLSRRKTTDLLWELCGVRLSLGALNVVEARVSDASSRPSRKPEARRRRRRETHRRHQLAAGRTVRALWTIATKAATVFKILADNSKKTLEPLYGSLRGILVSDRAKALGFWAMAALARAPSPQASTASPGRCATSSSTARRSGLSSSMTTSTRQQPRRREDSAPSRWWRKRSDGTQSDRGNMFAGSA